MSGNMLEAYRKIVDDSLRGVQHAVNVRVDSETSWPIVGDVHFLIQNVIYSDLRLLKGTL